LGGERWEFPHGPISEFIVKNKEMIKISPLLLFIATPKEMDRGEQKATRRLRRSKIEVSDMVHSLQPNFV
jgi:hypothetical protein